MFEVLVIVAAGLVGFAIPRAQKAVKHRRWQRMWDERNAPYIIDAHHLAHQREWSEATFGPGDRLLGVLDHIRKELREIEDDPTDLSEWVDVIILAFDGAWRAGWEPQEILNAVADKQAKNEQREWPDWRTMRADQAIEHVRSVDVFGRHSADGAE